jgi:DNA-binding LytR/AlgR family response regulator
MNAPTAILAEDELPQRQELRAMLAELWPQLNVIAECDDGLSALDAVQRLKPQVLFLDIRMPGVSGLEVARAAGSDCHVIFVTAYEEYALRAFDEGAIDYLQKPVARERLVRSIERARARLERGAGVDLASLLDRLQEDWNRGARPSSGSRPASATR